MTNKSRLGRTSPGRSMSERVQPHKLSALLVAILGANTVISVAYAAPGNGFNLDAIARAQDHITQHAGAAHFGAQQALNATDVVIDSDGAEHVRFNRTYKGLRVVGGDLVVHSNKAHDFSGVSQTLAHDLDLDVAPGINPAEASRLASSQLQRSHSVGKVERVVYARNTAPTLAYDVLLLSTKADGTPSELHVIVDANNGVALDQWDDILDSAAAGTGKGYFNGSVVLITDLVGSKYYLRDPSRGDMYTVNMGNKQGGNGAIFTDVDNVWGDFSLANTQTVGVDAQYGTAVTWEYFLTQHGRTGIANDGKGAYNRVHYGRNYNNAFWSDSCFCMTYGDGDGKTFNPFDSLDVAGHEMSHGVTSRSANLTYSGESGGLNEGTSDIFGSMVEYFANNANDPGDYLIGEQLYKSGGKALRSMIKPSSDGVSADCWYSSVKSLDVHYSSGVANHFFYLLAEGTTAGSPSPTCVAGNTRVATGTGSLIGIGRDKAAKIWYRALTVYMTSSTDYAGARTATITAANDLFGAGSAESIAVAAAWTLVNRP